MISTIAGGNNSDPTTYQMASEFTDGMNILGLVVFAILLGISIGKMGESGKILVSFFQVMF